jgi:hypothetical protein
VFNEPRPDEADMQCEAPCLDCQRGGKPPDEALEMMAETAAAVRRLRPKGRRILDQ